MRVALEASLVTILVSDQVESYLAIFLYYDEVIQIAAYGDI